ncbi:MAG: hypothetical protein H7Z11_22675 [Verrucomicrobia bacterium]|nr:hypothetical protein [Leptolyngbya sp. ES-bin-22]
MTKDNLSLTVLKQYLKDCPKEELANDIVELCKRFQPVKDYYQVKLSPEDETHIIAKYKQIIEKEFFPARGYGKAQLSVAKKAISECKKVCKNPVNMADMMLFYVEQGVKFTNAYGDISEPFYNSMESMYGSALKWIVNYDIQALFQPRCQKIVKDTSGIGWGFHDTLLELYEEIYES